MQSKNIVLIGFMGSGKTTVGKVLSKKIGYKYEDTDNLIELVANMSIKDIFSQLGESSFRYLEYRICATLQSFELTVISTGGGIIESVENRSYLYDAGNIIYLRTNFDTLVSRIKYNTDRPLFKQNMDSVQLLYQTRLSTYEQMADIIVDTDGLSQNQVANAIAKLL